ncbi:hypothetical protein FPV67DRAFT_1452341 [Lyophyllum atratum]|nr:hypothetical protein FPV67DRAFT_1452341 [Lyophyllum atratum]
MSLLQRVNLNILENAGDAALRRAETSKLEMGSMGNSNMSLENTGDAAFSVWRSGWRDRKKPEPQPNRIQPDLRLRLGRTFSTWRLRLAKMLPASEPVCNRVQLVTTGPDVSLRERTAVGQQKRARKGDGASASEDKRPGPPKKKSKGRHVKEVEKVVEEDEDKEEEPEVVDEDEEVENEDEEEGGDEEEVGEEGDRDKARGPEEEDLNERHAESIPTAVPVKKDSTRDLLTVSLLQHNGPLQEGEFKRGREDITIWAEL